MLRKAAETDVHAAGFGTKIGGLRPSDASQGFFDSLARRGQTPSPGKSRSVHAGNGNHIVAVALNQHVAALVPHGNGVARVVLNGSLAA